jgi:hypothetical protein
MTLNSKEMAQKELEDINRPFLQYDGDTALGQVRHMSLPEIFYIIAHGGYYPSDNQQDNQTDEQTR